MSSTTVAGAWVPSERLIGLAAEALADLFPADAAKAERVFAAACEGEPPLGAGLNHDWSGLNPADQRLAVWLRRHPSLGSRERRWLSDRVYDVLRHGRAYESWVRQEAAGGPAAWLGSAGVEGLRAEGLARAGDGSTRLGGAGRAGRGRAGRQALEGSGGSDGDARLRLARALIELSAANVVPGAAPTSGAGLAHEQVSALGDAGDAGDAGDGAGGQPVSGPDGGTGISPDKDPDKGTELLPDQYRAWLSAQPPALRFSLPDWLWAGLVQTHGEAVAVQLAEVLVQPAAIEIRTNLLKGKAQTLKTRLAEAGVEADEVPGSNTALRLKGRPALSRSPLFEAGWFEWQDVGSQQIAELGAARRGERVVDFCAGAGGKTLALAARMRNQGQVLAFDTDEARLSKLAPRLARAGVSIVTSMRLAGTEDPRLARYQRWADLVLVDAPCSGSGTFRRHPDLKWRLKPADVGHHQALQRQILQAAVRLLRPGGRLVYATCSLLDQENGQQMAWFGHWLAGQGGALARMVRQSSQYWLPESAGGDAFFMSEWRLPK